MFLHRHALDIQLRVHPHTTNLPLESPSHIGFTLLQNCLWLPRHLEEQESWMSLVTQKNTGDERTQALVTRICGGHKKQQVGVNSEIISGMRVMLVTNT